MAKRKLPNHISGTVRQWRARKRRELQDVVDALDTLRLGCAFTPVRGGIIEITLILRRMQVDLRSEWDPNGGPS